ncbi:lycopene cyclase family protein [Marinigracilibium pacificum]|uniref:Lycopene cyclase n=1 Tax=Marinigracilibium pacificum TaxID=2729599 RepID=A0A848J4T1_9BACT|nr:lycopene cyclase family protein [Marinigracilibium pacificum]NMM50288.1 lycopene cyclase [Marinigracilibium pacificum]
MSSRYDYIIAGGGAAGFILVDRILESNLLKNKSILIIDKDDKCSNDRTWCFWENDNGYWDEIVFKKWENAIFKDNNNTIEFQLDPYKYKMIRGIDFYTYIKKRIAKFDNVTLLKEEVVSIEKEGDYNRVITSSDNSYLSSLVFNSIPDFQQLTNNKKYPLVLQHFIGWYIETDKSVFDDSAVTFMDFSVSQKENTRFMYILPVSKTKALVEYTLFSPELLEDSEYENEIENYINNVLNISSYNILEKEKGAIPMTSFPFKVKEKDSIINIGTRGGSTKASTGFTFKRIMKNTEDIISFLEGKSTLNNHNNSRYRYYDMLLIDVLFDNNKIGSSIFSSLFRKNNPVEIFEFLDEKTSIQKDLEIMYSCPQTPFIYAFFKRLFYRTFLN